MLMHSKFYFVISRGNVTSLKLSPNLRKMPKVSVYNYLKVIVYG